MFVTEKEFQVKQEYYKDQMRAAQRYQRAKSLNAQGNRRFTLAQVMAWLGSRLADWGKSLQERYGTVVSPTVPQPR